METFLPLLERLGLPLSFLAIAIIAFIRGDVVPKGVLERALTDLERERRETDRFLDMCIRLLEDARDSQHIGQEAIQVMRARSRHRSEEQEERNKHTNRGSILDRESAHNVPEKRPVRQ